MTEKQKERWRNVTSQLLVSMIPLLFFYVLTSFQDNGRNIEKDINDLKLNKASIKYVDEKCLYIETHCETDISEVKQLLSDLDKKSDRTIELILSLHGNN